MDTVDPYQILSISKTASQDEIKNAYRDLAKKYHPDLNPGNKAAESKFKEISHAYELIGTPEARAKFDRGEFEEQGAGQGFSGFGARRRPYYHQTQEGQGPGGAGRYTFTFGEGGVDEELFSSIFGNLGKGARSGAGETFRMRGQDHVYRMQIDLRDAVTGAEKDLTLPTGKRIAVKIPPGVTNGTRLRFAGFGDPGIGGGPPGDAYIEIRVREDERFKQVGDQLILELPVSLTEAVFGAEVRVPTIDGAVLLRIPPRSNTGTHLKLSGKGAYNRTTKHRGDQIVILKVVLPEKIDPELESALRSWQIRHCYNPRERGAA